jgi:uncharacterized protein with LGFP repeats
VTRRTRLTWTVLVGAVLALGVTAAVLGATGSDPHLSTSADFSQFQPGDIISDAAFFNPGTMDAGDVQTFLSSKGASCTGSYCLKSYRADSNDRPAATAGNPGCPQAYTGAPGETAATMIYRVSQACGINPEVLLVTLQKESGLITARNPSAATYTAAMGYGCPDTAACDSTYNGLFNQLYMAARQFQRYRAGVAGSYRAGRTYAISYYPKVANSYGDNTNNQRCGTQTVTIANAATAGLYNYTPYVPNAAALAAGYGTGNTCSSYGNRNFWAYMSDWFGGPTAITDEYTALLASGVNLGNPQGGATCDQPRSGCKQVFDGGTIFWSPGSGAHVVRGNLLLDYLGRGGPAGVLGYPLTDDAAVPGVTGGYWNQFQYGALIWSAGTGPHMVRGAILDRYWALGGPAGALGFPVGDDAQVPGGYTTAFANGAIYWSTSTGAHMVRGALLDRYTSYGGPGVLGYPTADDGATADGAGALVPLTGAAIYWKQSEGATHVVRGNLRNRYDDLGGTTGLLGWPTGDDTAVPGGYLTTFSGGTLFWSQATGAKMVRGALLAKYTGFGGPAVLGFPTADDGPAPNGGALVEVGGGSIYWSPSTGAHVVRGALRDRWLSLGGATGMLGYPTGDDTQAGSGYLTAFSGGTLFWSSPTGARYVRGAILERYTASGGPAALGFPLGDDGPAPGGGAQVELPGAGVYWSPATGAHLVRGNLRDRWLSLGGTTGPLGYPTGDDTQAGVGYLTAFSGGTLFWSRVDGAHMVRGALLDEYVAAGGPAQLGFPLADDGPTPAALPGGAWVPLDGGALYWSPGTGAHLVEAPASGTYAAAAVQHRLGYPTTDTHDTPEGARTDFQHGWLLAPVDGGPVTETDAAS